MVMPLPTMGIQRFAALDTRLIASFLKDFLLQVVSILLRYLFIDLLWQYSSLRSAPDVTASSIKLFSDRQHTLMEHLESSLLNKHLSFDVRDQVAHLVCCPHDAANSVLLVSSQAFDLLCDLLLAFTPALLMDTPFAECLVPLSGASVEALTAHFIARINGTEQLT